MRICVVGAGAIGGLMGVKLAEAGEDVTFVDQGAQLAAIKANGLKLVWEDGTEIVAMNAKATDRIDEIGEQDLVILALKAHYLESVAPQVSSLLGPETMIVTIQNGIPWWYFHNHGGPHDGHRLDTLDPTEYKWEKGRKQTGGTIKVTCYAQGAEVATLSDYRAALSGARIFYKDLIDVRTLPDNFFGDFLHFSNPSWTQVQLDGFVQPRSLRFVLEAHLKPLYDPPTDKKGKG